MDTRLFTQSVQTPAKQVSNSLLLHFSTSHSTIEPWGGDWARRDRQLMNFWHTESYLASAIASIVMTRASLSYLLEGPPKSVSSTQRILDASDFNKGWTSLISKLSLDLLCLSGRTNVELGGDRLGQTKFIEDIVKDKDIGPVLSVDSNGNLVEKRITNWYKSPLGNRKWWWVSLKYASNHNRSNKGGIFLTNDHPLLTDRGWVNAEDITPGMKVATKYLDPSEDQMEVIIGGLLGDMSVQRLSRVGTLSLGHSKKQEDWFDFKLDKLKDFNWGNKHYQTYNFNNGYPPSETVGAKSKGSISFAKIYDRWYGKEGKLVDREQVEKYFSPKMLAIWYCDDGSINRSGKNPYSTISTNGFSKEDVEWLVDLLNKNNIKSNISQDKRYDQYYIHISTVGTKILSDYIGAYVPPSMRYKLPDNSPEYDSNLWKIKSAKIYYDTVVESRAREQNNKSRTKIAYCIDVEDTHNFVAANMIAHNCTDNGAFLEVIRDKKRPGQKPENAPVLGLANLPSTKCVRTGDPRTPVIYIDNDGVLHNLKWYQVITFEELPSTQPNALDRQVCFVSRVLKAAEIIKDISTYNSEKISGRFARALHLVGGVSQAEIERIQERSEIDADNRGLQRYLQPIIMAALDPNAKVSHEQIDLASLPDAFDMDITMKWYISVIAMAAGGDFQDFAPLPGGNLGTASQSETLHRKSQRKGNALFMKMIETRLQAAKVIPPNVTFRFSQQDAAAELEQANIAQVRANTRATQLNSLEITPEVAQQLAVEAGDLKQTHLVMMGATPDGTVDITVQDDEKVPDIEKSVTIDLAWAAAKSIEQAILNHPVNGSMPLNNHQLGIFTTALRNAIKYEQLLGTSEEWQSAIITKAAHEAGIQAHMIRMRLPDDFKVLVTRDGVWENGQLIYVKKEATPEPKRVKRVQIAKGSQCFVCNKSAETYVYTNQWKPVCSNHKTQGLVGKQNPQYDLPELIEAYKKQSQNVDQNKAFGLFVATICYASELKYGKINAVKVKEIATKCRLAVGIVPPELLVHHILSI